MTGDALEALRVLILWYRQHRPHNCFYCGRSLQTRPRRSPSWPRGRIKPNQRTWDHVIARGRGGMDCIENQVACCHPCNEVKGQRTLENFRQLAAIAQATGDGRMNMVDGKFYGEREYLEHQTKGQTI